MQMEWLGQRVSEIDVAQPRLVLTSLRTSDNDAFVNSAIGVATNRTGMVDNGRPHHAQCRY
jgi:hypothetical protein